MAIVCTPRAEAIAAAAEWVAPGGALCVYAPPPPGTALGIEGERLFTNELAVTASYGAGAADMRAALALLRSGRVDPAPLVTHRLGLDDTARALELARRGESLKAVIVP